MSSRVLEYERDGLPASLRRAVQLLREEPEPGSRWQGRVMRAVERSAPPRGVAGRWSMRPSAAIAAGVLCALLGGAATAMLTRAPDVAPPRVAAVSAPHVRFSLDAPGATTVPSSCRYRQVHAIGPPRRRALAGYSSWFSVHRTMAL